MSSSAPLPPAYEKIAQTYTNYQSQEPIWTPWYLRLISLDFNHDDATKYAKLFVENDVEINMISELTDGILKDMGIEKAGHRIRILRLQKQNVPSTSSRTVATTSAVVQSVTNTPKCAWHPQIVANDKCYRCGRLLCLHCRRDKVVGNRTRHSCNECHDECIIL